MAYPIARTVASCARIGHKDLRVFLFLKLTMNPPTELFPVWLGSWPGGGGD